LSFISDVQIASLLGSTVHGARQLARIRAGRVGSWSMRTLRCGHILLGDHGTIDKQL
jgi:hypothetical protein